MKTIVTILLALAFAGFLTTAQAQTNQAQGPVLVPKWTNTTVFAGTIQANADGGAYNPSTGNLLVSSAFPNMIVVCRPSDGASNAVLSLAGVSGGDWAVCGLTIDTNGVIYACNGAASGGTKLYSWANESATPVNFASSTLGAGNVGQTMARYGAGNNAVFILSSSTTGAVYVYNDGTAWRSKQLTVSSGTVMAGFSIVSWCSTNCAFITKNISGAGNYNTFNPGASSPITVVQTAFSSTPLGISGSGSAKVSIIGAGGYDPVTGLFGFHTFTLTASPFTISNYLVLTTSNTLAAPGGCAPVTSAVGVNNTTIGSGAHYGADFWGNGVFYTLPAQPASRGFGFRAYDVTAFPVADISPAAITTNTGASVTFSVVSGGSSLSYQWQVNTGSGYVNVSGSEFFGANSNKLTISPAGTNDTGSYLCTVTGVSGSGWISSAASLTVVPSSPMAGVAYADSTDFTLNTGGTLTGLAGVAFADSSDFTLNTGGVLAGLAGVAYADSSDFTLNTGGALAGLAGVAFADSSDFTLNTLNSVVSGLPHFTSISVSGRTLTLNATNGTPGGQYTLLSTTNLALNLWTTVLTGTFDSSGTLNLTATNLINPAAPQQFYMLKQ